MCQTCLNNNTYILVSLLNVDSFGASTPRCYVSQDFEKTLISSNAVYETGPVPK